MNPYDPPTEPPNPRKIKIEIERPANGSLGIQLKRLLLGYVIATLLGILWLVYFRVAISPSWENSWMALPLVPTLPELIFVYEGLRVDNLLLLSIVFSIKAFLSYGIGHLLPVAFDLWKYFTSRV